MNIARYFQKEFGRHAFDYLILLTAGVLLLLGLRAFSGERLVEFVILFAFTALYVIWGIYHHIVDDTLRLKTVVEYILIGFTIIFLLKIILFP